MTKNEYTNNKIKMSDILMSPDLLPIIIDFCKIENWTKIARVCKFWLFIINKKKSKFKDSLKFIINNPQTDRYIAVPNYVLTAYNQFTENYIWDNCENYNDFGHYKKITAYFTIGNYTGILQVFISEMDIIYNLFPNASEFSNDLIFNITFNIVYADDIEKYINIEKLADLDSVLTLENEEEYYSFRIKNNKIETFADKSIYKLLFNILYKK